MADNKKNKAIEDINKTIDTIKQNKSTFYFFTIDCKNTPNSSVSYIYNIAKSLFDKGYDVKMLYQLEDEYSKGDLYKLKKNNDTIDYNKVFVGVGEWLGEEYASLPHLNIATEEISIAASDFLFIPEAFASLMFETYKHKLPCKRYVILQNYDYVTDFTPLGTEWKNYGIYDVITTCENQAKLIKNVFPYVNVNILPPYISDIFRTPIYPKNLVVNIVTKDQKYVNRVIKPFYWKYPMYKFISFRDLRNFPKQKFAELLKEGIITIWIDEQTSFGYVPLEAMRCDNIVIGKIPEVIPEWMKDKRDNINNTGVWVYDINSIPDVLAKVIGSWMRDEIPSEFIEAMNSTKGLYTHEEWEKNISSLFEEIKKEQIQTLNEVKKTISEK